MGSLDNTCSTGQNRETMEASCLVLIVQGDPGQAHQLKALLLEQGHQVAVAVDGKQALTEAKQLKPNLVICGRVMPGIDGYTMCHALKQDGGLKEIPLILITGAVEPKDLVRELQAGADYCITGSLPFRRYRPVDARNEWFGGNAKNKQNQTVDHGDPDQRCRRKGTCPGGNAPGSY
jgi:CheY-like chemotaxis protein